MSEPTFIPSPSGNIRFEINPDTLNNISRAFYTDPSLISIYKIDPTTLNSGIYDRVFEIYNKLAGKGAEAINGLQIDEILKEGSYTEVEKNGLREYFAMHEGSTNMDNCVKNIKMYYEDFRKQYILMTYQNNGMDISDYWPQDKKYVRLDGTPDINGMEKAKTTYEGTTADGIVNAMMDKYMSLAKSPDVKLEHSSSVQLFRGRQLPGGDKEIEYLIGSKAKNLEDFDNGWMELGSFNSIVAAAKAGKTQLAMQMAFCVQNGIPFFDFPVMQSDVLYVDYELRPNQIHKRLEMLESFYRDDLDRAGIIEAIDPYYISVSELFSKGDIKMDSIIRSVREAKEKHPSLRLIIFDCFYTFMEGDPNAEEDVKKCLLSLKGLVDDNTTVVYVHHTNKTGTKGMSDTDLIYSSSGSGVHAKIIDTTYVARPCRGSGLQFEVYATGRSCSGEKVICDKGAETKFFFKKSDKLTLMQSQISTEEDLVIKPYIAELKSKFDTLKRLKTRYPELYSKLVNKSGAGFEKRGIESLTFPDKIKGELDKAKAKKTAEAFKKFAYDQLGLTSYLRDKNTYYLVIGDDIKDRIQDIDDLDKLLDSSNYQNDLNNVVDCLVRQKFPEFFKTKGYLENAEVDAESF